MRMVWLMLCTIWLIFLASPVFAQLPEPGFDPRRSPFLGHCLGRCGR